MRNLNRYVDSTFPTSLSKRAYDLSPLLADFVYGVNVDNRIFVQSHKIKELKTFQEEQLEVEKCIEISFSNFEFYFIHTLMGKRKHFVVNDIEKEFVKAVDYVMTIDKDDVVYGYAVVQYKKTIDNGYKKVKKNIKFYMNKDAYFNYLEGGKK